MGKLEAFAVACEKNGVFAYYVPAAQGVGTNLVATARTRDALATVGYFVGANPT